MHFPPGFGPQLADIAHRRGILHYTLAWHRARQRNLTHHLHKQLLLHQIDVGPWRLNQEAPAAYRTHLCLSSLHNLWPVGCGRLPPPTLHGTQMYMEDNAPASGNWVEWCGSFVWGIPHSIAGAAGAETPKAPFPVQPHAYECTATIPT